MNSQIKDKFSKTSDGETKNHQAFAMEESRLKKAKEICEKTGNCIDYQKLGGEKRHKEIENIVHSNQNVNQIKKEVGMKAGRENEFKKNHGKDKHNTNPTGVRLPRFTGSVSKLISSNKPVYKESLDKEISKMKYLIEYMNNNKK
jgi:hypothetical protein